MQDATPEIHVQPASTGGEQRVRRLVHLARRLAVFGRKYRWRELQLLLLPCLLLLIGTWWSPVSSWHPLRVSSSPGLQLIASLSLLLLVNVGLTWHASEADQLLFPIVALLVALGWLVTLAHWPDLGWQRLAGQAMGSLGLVVCAAGLPSFGRLVSRRGWGRYRRVRPAQVGGASLLLIVCLALLIPGIAGLNALGLAGIAAWGAYACVLLRQHVVNKIWSGRWRRWVIAAIVSAAVLSLAVGWLGNPAFGLVTLVLLLLQIYAALGHGLWCAVTAAPVLVLLISQSFSRYGVALPGSTIPSILGGTPGIAGLMESFGLATVLVALACHASLAQRGIRSALIQPATWLRLVALGATGILTMATLLSGATWLRWLSETPVDLPLIDPRGAPLAVYLVMAGILLGVSRPVGRLPLQSSGAAEEQPVLKSH